MLSRSRLRGYTSKSTPYDHQGETATLRWTVVGQAQVAIDPGIGASSPTGAIVVRPLNTTRYTLTATGPRGTVATKDVTLTVAR